MDIKLFRLLSFFLFFVHVSFSQSQYWEKSLYVYCSKRCHNLFDLLLELRRRKADGIVIESNENENDDENVYEEDLKQ